MIRHTVSRVAYVQWREGLLPNGDEWDAIRRDVAIARPDLLITNEMPFGPWLAESPSFDNEAARRSVALHEGGIAALAELEAGAVISSRPVFQQGRLANEAFVIDNGSVRPIHRKQYFPQECGWYEEAWFAPGRDTFAAVQIGDLRVGVLLCTELFFNERARAYGRHDTDLIVVPRAAGTSLDKWRIAMKMAAIVSGAYIISSNRAGATPLGLQFGGAGMAVTPDGTIAGETSERNGLALIDVSAAVSRAQKSAYPCYVKE